jgi:hypothetical protein
MGLKTLHSAFSAYIGKLKLREPAKLRPTQRSPLAAKEALRLLSIKKSGEIPGFLYPKMQ